MILTTFSGIEFEEGDEAFYVIGNEYAYQIPYTSEMMTATLEGITPTALIFSGPHSIPQRGSDWYPKTFTGEVRVNRSLIAVIIKLTPPKKQEQK